MNELETLRRREIQMLGAAISLRNWHDAESAYNQARDRVDRMLARATGIVAPAPGTFAGLLEAAQENMSLVKAGVLSDKTQESAARTARLEAEIKELRVQLAQTIMQQDEEWQKLKARLATKDRLMGAYQDMWDSDNAITQHAIEREAKIKAAGSALAEMLARNAAATEHAGIPEQAVSIRAAIAAWEEATSDPRKSGE